MKKSLLLIGLSVLILAGCASNKVIQPRSTVQGTISYYNLEKDRGSGQETEYGKSHLAVYLNLDQKYVLNKGKMYRVSLGCTSGEKTTLYRNLIKIAGRSETTAKSYIRETEGLTSLPLPEDLDQGTVVIEITKPINLYKLDTELPDQGRVGSCYAFSNIRNIVLK